MIDSTVLEFVASNKISVLTTLLENVQPHSAALQYTNSDELNFVFLTEKDSRKCQNLTDLKEHPASLVIGFNAEEMITLQLEGGVKILTGEELENGWNVYRSKYPGAVSRKTDEKFVLLGFSSSWWRYTDLIERPWKIISS